MSLSVEQFNAAKKEYSELNKRVNDLFLTMSIPLIDKIQMDHYGRLYLFGKNVNKLSTDVEIIEIITSTSKETWNWHIDFFGQWGEKSQKGVNYGRS